MASKAQLVDRVEFVKGLIEEKGQKFEYSLPKNFKKDDIFVVLNQAHKVYDGLK